MVIPIEEQIEFSPIIPVIEIRSLDCAIALADTFSNNGIKVLEIVLRTPVAMQAIQNIIKQTDCTVGVGSVLYPDHVQAAKEAGAKFVVSPGFTKTLVDCCINYKIPILPGVSTVSEMMQLNEIGLRTFKFFPASSSGGVEALKSISGPLPHLSFCPTGGVNKKNFLDYLSLPNVFCVGGSWLAPPAAIERGQWDKIATEIVDALDQLK